MHEGVLLLGGVEVGDEERGDEMGEEGIKDGKEYEDRRVHLDGLLAVDLGIWSVNWMGRRKETHPFT